MLAHLPEQKITLLDMLGSQTSGIRRVSGLAGCYGQPVANIMLFDEAFKNAHFHLDAAVRLARF